MWFQRGFRVVWNRVVSEWFQSDLSPRGFRVVSEWSEPAWFQYGFRWVWNCVVSEGFQTTVWFQSGFRVVWNRVVSEWFQRGLKPCGFRVVLEWSETVWFQSGFRVVWNRVVSEGFQRSLNDFGQRLLKIYCDVSSMIIYFQKSSCKIIQWKIIPNFYWEIARMKLSKKHFGRIAIFHSKNLLEAPKNLKKSLGKSIQTKNHTGFYWEKHYKKKH